MQGYWEQLQVLLGRGEPFVSVTLVDVVASAPAEVGSKMLVTREGLFFGTVGGGKIELKALAEAREALAQPQGPATRFVEWNLQRDVGMTCGGAVRLFFETYNNGSWQIVIFGAGHCAQALVRLLLTLQCHLTVIDAREEWLARLPSPASASAKLRIIKADRELKEYVRDLPQNAFVLLMTMGHGTDQPILIEILKSRGTPAMPAFPYVGVIGSEAKAAALRRGLLAAGLPEADATARSFEGLNGGAGKYYCPMGLPVGSNDPAEIAISVAGQLLQMRDALRGTAHW
jgi:xanthine dehydrogenase accessory factor